MRRHGRGTPRVKRCAAGVYNHGRRHAASRISSASTPVSSGSAAVCGRDASWLAARRRLCDRFHLPTSLVAHLRTTLVLIAICATSGFVRASSLTSLGRSVRTATRVFPALEPSSHRVPAGDTLSKKTYRLCIGLFELASLSDEQRSRQFASQGRCQINRETAIASTSSG